MSSAKIQWIEDLEHINEDFAKGKRSALSDLRKGEVYIPSSEYLYSVASYPKRLLGKRITGNDGYPKSIFDHPEVRYYVGENYNESNSFKLGYKLLQKGDAGDGSPINAFVNTSLFTKNAIESQTIENSLKTIDLFFDHDAGDDIRKLTLEEKKAHFKGDIEKFCKAHEDFWGVKPNYITMVSGGYHSHTICDRFTGISEHLIDLINQGSDNIENQNDETKAVLKRIISLKTDLLSSDLPKTQNTLHDYLYPAFCYYVDMVMGVGGYLDLSCGSIARLTRDIGFYHTKDYSNPSLISPCFENLCDNSSAISFDKVNLDLITSDIQTKILDGMNKKLLKSQNSKLDNSKADSVFSDNKTEDEKLWIKKQAIELLKNDPLFSFIIENEVKVGYNSWCSLASNIAPFSYDDNGKNPAFDFFKELTQKCRMPKHFSTINLVWVDALKRVAKGQLSVTYETILNQTKGHKKYPTSSKLFENFDKSKFIKRSPYHSLLSLIKDDFYKTYSKSLYDNAKLNSFKDLGLSLDKNGNVLNILPNLRIVLQKNELLQKMFRFDKMANCIKAHHSLRNFAIDYSKEIEDQIQNLLIDDFMPLYAISITDDLAKVVQTYLYQVYSIQFEFKNIISELNSTFKAHPKKELGFHLVHDMLRDRKEEWIKAGCPNVLDTWLPESHHIDAKSSPLYYKYLQIKSRKLLLGHIERAYSTGESASKVEYFFGSVGSGEGTGKSTQSDTILLSLFGINPKDEKSKRIITRLKTDEDVLNKSDKDLLMLVEGKFISIIEELSQDIISKKGSDHLKMMITKAKVEGRRPWAISNEILAFTHLHYFTSNNPNILYEQDTDHRRYLIDSLDYLDETNPLIYATKLINKTSKKIENVFVNSKGNAGFIDRDTQWDMLRLAWGQAFAYYCGDMPESEIARLREEGRLLDADGIDMDRAEKTPSIKVKREDLMLSNSEQEIVGKVNRKFQNQNDCIQSILTGFLKTHKENYLEANHFKSSELYKEYADNAKWKQIVKVFGSLEFPLAKKRLGTREVYRFVDNTGKVLNSNPYLENSTSSSLSIDPLDAIIDNKPIVDNEKEALLARIKELEAMLSQSTQKNAKIEDTVAVEVKTPTQVEPTQISHEIDLSDDLILDCLPNDDKFKEDKKVATNLINRYQSTTSKDEKKDIISKMIAIASKVNPKKYQGQGVQSMTISKV